MVNCSTPKRILIKLSVPAASKLSVQFVLLSNQYRSIFYNLQTRIRKKKNKKKFQIERVVLCNSVPGYVKTGIDLFIRT